MIHKDCDSSEEEGGDVGSASGVEDEDTEVRQHKWLRSIQADESHATAWN